MTPALLANGTLFVVTAGYIMLCASSPFGNCRKCKGWGYAVKADRRGRLHRGRYCRRCQSTGKRIRVGRHLWNLTRRIHHDGTR